MNFNILGIGSWQIIIVLLVMLIVAGPKRMVLWAYQAGRYVAMFRKMFDETMSAFQKEMQESGIDLTKDLTSLQKESFDVINEASKVINAEPTNTPASSGTTAPTIQPSQPPAQAAAEPPKDNTDSTDKPRYDSWTPS